MLVLHTCEETLEELGPFLRDEAGEIIELRERHELRGSSHLLEPVRPLRPLTNYEVHYESRGEEDFPLVLVTSTGTDHEAPEWRARPQLDVKLSGAQKGLRAHFETEIGEPLSRLLPLLRLKRLETDEEVLLVGIESIEGDAWSGIVFGSGEPWRKGLLQFGGSYEAAISFLDLAGNQSTERKVRFRTPDPPPPERCEATTTLDGGVARARVEPECTELAIRARVQGTVEGKLEVGRDGSVRRVSISKPLPMGLDEATRKALGSWQFEPAEIELRQIFFETRFSLSQQPHEPVWRELP